MLVQRTEQHIIKRSHPYYNLLKEKCHLAKNIYNHANFLIRQHYFKTKKYLQYTEVEKLMHDDTVYTDYWNLGLANSSQQILRVVDKNWKSFFKTNNDYKKHPHKYTGRPKIPKYLKKNSYKEFVLTTNQAKLKNDNGYYISFPKALKGLIIKPKFVEKDFVKFNQAKIIPGNDIIIIELIYTIEIKDFEKIEHKNISSIDLGIDNFVTFVDNLGNAPIIINGKGLKSKNKYYNKLIAETQSLQTFNGNTNYSYKMYAITNYRNNYMNTFMHTASKKILDICVQRDITCIVIGKNKQWKTNSKMSKLVNQTFVQIPYNSFIDKLKYKALALGIEIIEVEESYTSGTSFLDNELPIKENYNKKRRIHRGLFKSNEGKLINADVNAACQIMRKVFATEISNVYNPIKM